MECEFFDVLTGNDGNRRFHLSHGIVKTAKHFPIQHLFFDYVQQKSWKENHSYGRKQDLPKPEV